ncbi:MAG: 16S rRNA (cytosine(1402)-N(4))-methyltransferase RsmH [Acidimicrobiales bacterium]
MSQEPSNEEPLQQPNGPFDHVPVMVGQVVELLSAVPEGVVLDATVGGGGHARVVLLARSDVQVIGLDRDPAAVAAASRALSVFGERARVIKERFDRLGEVLDRLGVERLSGALFDLGLSSPQVDQAGRGFSYRLDGPLDMRMDPTQELTAALWLNEASQEQLAALFAAHGEARFARQIAAGVVGARPVLTTAELVEAIEQALPPAARRRGHPAKRVFQALRAVVNAELEVLPVALDLAIDRLVPGGRVVAISYHSGEDRIVKGRFVTASTGGCTCPPGLPCACGAMPKVRLLNRGAKKPSTGEVLANPRSRSARLRAVEALSRAEVVEKDLQ